MTTGKQIRNARRRAGLTQKELGEKLNVSQSAIGQFENENSNPNLKTIRKIADALNIPISELVDDWGQFSQEEMLSDWGEAIVDETVQKVFSELECIENSDGTLNDELFEKNYNSIIALTQNASSASKTFFKAQIEKYTKEMSLLLAKLNDTGKEEALKRVSELTRLSEYMGVDLNLLNITDQEDE